MLIEFSGPNEHIALESGGILNCANDHSLLNIFIGIKLVSLPKLLYYREKKKKNSAGYN